MVLHVYYSTASGFGFANSRKIAGAWTKQTSNLIQPSELRRVSLLLRLTQMAESVSVDLNCISISFNSDAERTEYYLLDRHKR